MGEVHAPTGQQGTLWGMTFRQLYAGQPLYAGLIILMPVRSRDVITNKIDPAGEGGGGTDDRRHHELAGADQQRPRPAVEQLAEVPEETIWLQKQKSVRARRAYRLDVQHFMRALARSASRRRRSCARSTPKPQSGDRLGAVHARDRARGSLDLGRQHIRP